MVFSALTFFISIIITFLITGIATWTITFVLLNSRTQEKLRISEQERATAQAQITHLQESLENAHNIGTQLEHTFESLSSRVLRENSSTYLEQTKQHLHRVVDPLLKDMEKLESNIRGMESKREGAYSSMAERLRFLHEQILQLQQSNKNLDTSAQNLRSALQSESATRGKWGEIQLRRIVELSGMAQHIDFEMQVHATSDLGQKQRPDMIVHLPQKGAVFVDAKTPMNAYLAAYETKSIDEKEALLKNHTKALRDHMKSLAKKEYWNISAHNTPQIVILFLPYESGLGTSFERDPTLLDEALDNKIIIASPSTLYAFLKAISYGWMQVELSKNSRAIADLSKELVERFKVFSNHFSTIRTGLAQATNAFNKATGSFNSRLLPTMHKIENLRGGSNTFADQDTLYVENSVDTSCYNT